MAMPQSDSPHPKTRTGSRVIVGTAGHIDHGKTTLIQALTGIDCDRWEEEKRRGITIDLGFAYLVAGDLQVGFIDVPGHERLLHNALAGIGGVRVMLLVVAADEGVMPQTREHLAVCSLLGIPNALVALTKVDTVDAELAELAELEVAELLASTPFAEAPILHVSSRTGEGVEVLKERLLELCSSVAISGVDDHPLRLPIDRVFQLKGLGTVATGTLTRGTISVGDVLEIQPGGLRATARSLQVHGRDRVQAVHGERTSVQLAGVGVEELGRGMQIVSPRSHGVTDSLLVRLRVLEDWEGEIDEPLQVRLHHLSADALGWLRPIDPPTLAPGTEGIVEFRLRDPLVAVRDDRVIVRRLSPVVTLGGGEVLDPAWRRPRRAPREALKALTGDRRDWLRYWIERGAYRGEGSDALARRLGDARGQIEQDLAALASDGDIQELTSDPGQPDRWIASPVAKELGERAHRILERAFARNTVARTVPKAELAQKLAPGMTPQLVRPLVDWLAGNGIVEVEGDRVTLPGHSVVLSDEDQRLSEEVLERFEARELQPPTVDELRDELVQQLPRELTAGIQQRLPMVMAYLAEESRLERLPNRRWIASRAVERLAQDLRAEGWARFSVPQFKDRFGLTRKWAIPVLEHLDSVGLTRRLGDDRMVVPPTAPSG